MIKIFKSMTRSQLLKYMNLSYKLKHLKLEIIETEANQATLTTKLKSKTNLLDPHNSSGIS